MKPSIEPDECGEGSGDEAFVQRWPKVALEAEILAVLDGPLLGGSKDLAYRIREHEIAQVFARLTVLDARELHRRLSIPAADDRIAARFGRMILDRRQRLLAVLADARRREALASAQGRP
jgi:hypothetical protein